MFSVEFLNVLRAYELAFIERYLARGAKILEIGGGTGVQARELSSRGYDVVSIDLPASGYAHDRVFPIIEYDGRKLPFDDASFDIVLSSNVLEHVPDLGALYQEFERVLKPGGYGVHVMPTGTWRGWTIVANYVEMLQRIFPLAPGLLPRRLHWREGRRMLQVLANAAKLVVVYGIPPRHGEFGNAFTEIRTFSRRWWLRHLDRHGYAIEAAEPMGLFYTGHMVLGMRLGMERRTRLAQWLGSSCVLYMVKFNKIQRTEINQEAAK